MFQYGMITRTHGGTVSLACIGALVMASGVATIFALESLFGDGSPPVSASSATPLPPEFAPRIGDDYMICYAIEGRTKGAANVSFGGVPIMGTGANSVTFDLWYPACASVTAVKTDGLSVKTSADFDGEARAIAYTVTPSAGGPLGEFRSEISRKHPLFPSMYAGENAGRKSMDGFANIGIGRDALASLLTGEQNIAIGTDALANLTGAKANVAVGLKSLHLNTTGYNNTAVGTASLESNTTGFDNAAFGIRALALTTTGRNNTALGTDVFEENVTGMQNSGFGAYAGRMNKTSNNNTVGGYGAMYRYVGELGQNTAVGVNAIGALTEGGSNVALGVNAGLLASAAYGSIWIGVGSGNQPQQNPNVTNSVAIGLRSWTDADNQISLGNSDTREVRTWGSINFKKGYPASGKGAPVGSLFMGADGGLYFKDRNGAVIALVAGGGQPF